MAKISTKPLSGMRDFLPADVARRNYVVGVVRGVYERYGFLPLETPALENLSILVGKYGEDEKLIYRILHRGDTLARVLERGDLSQEDLADQALRYDLTVPLARVVAQYGSLPRYFKRYQIQPVWRADRPGKGRYREFFQCDVDALGSESMVAEAEVASAVGEALLELGFADFRININHRQLLRALIRGAGIPSELEGTSLQAVDKFDKVGRNGVEAELRERGIDDGAAGRLLNLVIRPEDESQADRISAVRRALDDEAGLTALDQLNELFGLLEHTPARGRWVFDPLLARGLGYYTGPIFEIRIPGFGFSFAGGGRYDELVGVFGKQKIPAVGFSIGLERIVAVMGERNMYPDLRLGPQVMLCSVEVDRGQVLGIAHALRAQGLRVEVYPDPAKLGKQLQYADRGGAGAPFAAIVGESELAAGSVTLKHLASGDQSTIPVADVASTVGARLG